MVFASSRVPRIRLKPETEASRNRTITENASRATSPAVFSVKPWSAVHSATCWVSDPTVSEAKVGASAGTNARSGAPATEDARLPSKR